MMLNMNTPSLQVRRIARILAVIAIALAAGHLVQTLAARKPVDQVQAPAKTPVKVVQLSAGATAAGLAGPLQAPPVAHPVSALPVTALPAPICATALDLRQQPGAMIAVALSAPCHANERVVLRHAGLAVTALTGVDGKLATALPALAAEGRIEIRFMDGSKAEAAIAMPETVLLRRFGVQWQGAVAFAVHGLQNGADYGQPGDISAANPGRLLAATGGFLVLLGDAVSPTP